MRLVALDPMVVSTLICEILALLMSECRRGDNSNGCM